MTRCRTRTNWLLYAAPVAVWALTACGPSAREVANERSVPFRVVTWNIHGCENGLDGIVTELRRVNADAVCLQEVEIRTAHASGADQAAEIAGRLGMTQWSAGSPFAAGGEQRMAILARQPIEQAESLDAGTGRIYGVTGVIRRHDRHIRIVSFHLTSTYRTEVEHAVRTTRSRFEEATDLVRRASTWPEDLIVAGDLNATPGMPAHDLLTRSLGAAATTQPTFPSDKPRAPIDTVFHSAALRAGRAEVVPSSASDHRPVVVEFTSPLSPTR